MKYNQLGRTGLKVSYVCLGTMTWGCQNTEEDAHAQMDYALDQGINFFDTAELYAVPPEEHTQGLTEKYIGTWFAKTGNRDKVILASKVAGPGVPWINDAQGLTAKKIENALEASLKRLQTDYIDLYQLHWPNRSFPHFGKHVAGAIDYTKENTQEIEDNLLEILQTLDKATKAGKIRHIGLSDDTPWGIMKYLELADKHGLPRMASIQNEYSLMMRHDEHYLSEICAREDISYMPWSPLATGLLSGKYMNGAKPEGTRWSLMELDKRPGRYNHRDTENAHKAVKCYMDVATKHGLDVCQMALAFCYQQPFITSTIIGATTMNQLKANIAAKDMTLSKDVLQDIDAVYRQYPMPY